MRVQRLIARLERKLRGEREKDWHRGLLNAAGNYVGDTNVIARWVTACGVKIGDWPQVSDPKPGDVFNNKDGYRGIVIDDNHILGDDGEMIRIKAVSPGIYLCPLQGAWHKGVNHGAATAK